MPRCRRRGRHGQRDQPDRPPPLRRRAGDRAECRTATSCRRAGWTQRALRRRGASTARCTAAASRCRNPTSRPTALRAEGADRRRRASSPAPSSCTSPTTRRPAAPSGPSGCSTSASASPTTSSAAGFAYGIVTAHNGCLHLEVTVRGKQAHAAMPASGIDALEAATAILAALYAHPPRSPRRSPARRHRVAEAQRRADQGRHQHQRGAGPGRVPDRPPHDPEERGAESKRPAIITR